jgi:thiosulfate/3-mercaptopyruvate sulfurtransferase
MLMTSIQTASAFSLQRLDIQRGAQTHDSMVVLDARPQAQYLAGHIPGAFSFSWEDYTRPDSYGVNYRIFPVAELCSALGAYGISAQSTVLIYGDADTSWGGEGWLAWLFAYLGHQGPVYLLDGGIQAWQAARLPVVTTPPATVEAVCYTADVQQQLAISAQQIAARQDQITLVDTRNYWLEWIPGHLPQAVHLDWKEFYQGDTKSPLDGDALRQLLASKGIDVSKPVVYYCTGGIRSGYCWMVHELSGLPSAINFEGGTEEWDAYRKTP